MYSEAHGGIGPDHRLFFATSAPLGTATAGQKAAAQCRATELGTMLYCDGCGDVVFTEKVWKEAKALRVEMDPEDINTPEGWQARSEVVYSSIALRAKRRGYNSERTRGESRALAEIWWKDQSEAKRVAEQGLINMGVSFGPNSVLRFVVIVLGTALLLKLLGFDQSVGIPIGLVCWYANRYFIIRARLREGYNVRRL